MDARRRCGGMFRDGSAPAPSMGRRTGDMRAYEARSFPSHRVTHPEERVRTRSPAQITGGGGPEGQEHARSCYLG